MSSRLGTGATKMGEKKTSPRRPGPGRVKKKKKRPIRYIAGTDQGQHGIRV